MFLWYLSHICCWYFIYLQLGKNILFFCNTLHSAEVELIVLNIVCILCCVQCRWWMFLCFSVSVFLFSVFSAAGEKGKKNLFWSNIEEPLLTTPTIFPRQILFQEFFSISNYNIKSKAFKETCFFVKTFVKVG